MKLVFVAGVLLLAAQPAAAIQVVQMAPAANTTALADCAADARGCPAPPAETAPVLANGPLVAGLVGLLVVILAFGRRKTGLPEVVS